MSGRLKGFAAVLLAAAVFYAMQNTTPLYSDIISQVPVVGKPGERIDARDFALGVGEVHLARALEIESYGNTKTYTTSGLGSGRGCRRSQAREPCADRGRVDWS